MLLPLECLVGSAAGRCSGTMADISKDICNQSAVQQSLATMHAFPGLQYS